MGGRGASGGGYGSSARTRATLATIESAMEKSSIIQEGIQYGASSPFGSGYWTRQLEYEITKESDRQGKEITIKQTDKIVSQLKTYVEREREKIKTQREKERREKAELEEKTRQAKEYFARTYNPNREQRDITSSTYKRADRSLRKQVDSVLGISRKYNRRKR